MTVKDSKGNGKFDASAAKGYAFFAKDGGTLIRSNSAKHLYCVYYFSDDRGSNEKNRLNGDKEPIYYNYALTSYIYVDLPIVGAFKLPVYTKGERIYNFSDSQEQGARI